jgi:hypothetical protein
MSRNFTQNPRRSDAHLRRTPLQFVVVIFACVLTTGAIVELVIVAVNFLWS